MNTTVGEALERGYRRLVDSGIPRPSWEAGLLLAHAVERDAGWVLANREHPLRRESLALFLEAVERRARRVPLAYITGSKEFMSLPLRVDERVLIPRPETEVLVETALALWRRNPSPALTVADLGTGSGAIAVAIARWEPRCRVYATDISPAALEVAAENVSRLGVEGRVTLLAGDLLEPLRPLELEGHLDAILCNPPYVSEEEWERLGPEVREYEPPVALLAGRDPLHFYRRLAGEAGPWLKPGGFVGVEVGLGLAGPAADLFRRAGFERVGTVKDYAGIDRVVLGFAPLES